MNLESLIEAYTITAIVMFPILLFIIILLVRDLGKYSKLSDKINGVINNLSEDLNDKGFKREIRNLFFITSADISTRSN